MTVTFREKNGKKVIIYVDGHFAFALYPKEIKAYDLEDGADIDDELYESILSETVLPRAKRRLMNILIKSDKSEAELRRSLKMNDYDEDTIDKAIAYIDSYHYINETRAAESFIRAHVLNYSEKEIRFRLEQKGYREEAVDTAYELVLADFDNPELSAVCSFLRKKLPSGTDPNEDEFTENVQKAMAAAYRKGFGYEIIRQGMKELYRM